MPLGRINTSGSNQTQSIELNEIAPQGKKQSTDSNALGLAANDPSHQPIEPQGKQGSSVQETSFSTVPLKSKDGSAGQKVESALLKFKGVADHTAFKHLDGLFTGNKAGFTQAGSAGKVITGYKPLTDKQTTALSEEIASGIGFASKKTWDVGRDITKNISSAAKFDTLKDSVSAVPINKDAVAGVTGINTAFAGIAVIKSSAELVRDISLDALAHSERKTTQQLLKNYDAASGIFTDPSTGKPVSDEENAKLTTQLKELINKKGGDRARTAGQLAGDRVSTIRDIAIASGNVANGALLAARVAANATPGLSQALSGVNALHSTWKATTNIVALNNIQHAAKKAKDDPLLQAIASHVSQERIYNSRKNLLNASVNFASFGLGVAALAAGPGAPAALAVASIVASAANTATSLGTTAFELGHAYQLSQRRKEGSAEALSLFKEAIGNDALSARDKEDALKALGQPKNIGLAERALIDRLQNGSPEEVKTAVQFLENFGLSKGTISKLKLANTEKALTTLQSALYSDKVKFTLAGAKQSFYSLGKISGIPQFASFIKGKWDQYQARKANAGNEPFRSYIVNSVQVKDRGNGDIGTKVIKNRSTKDLIKGLNTQIHQHKDGKVSEEFAKLRDKYLKVSKPRIEFITREPVKIGADISLDESAWNPKTGTYDDF